MGLFASYPVEEVTVLDIAGAVDMTPAAVYYHFASKEQILLEGLEAFANLFLDEMRAHMPAKGAPDGVRNLVGHMVTWCQRNRTAASVYFVGSVGLNLLVEALRRETRLEMVHLLGDAVKTSRAKTTPAEVGVIAVALVSLLETASSSALNQDLSFRSLGARKFVDEVKALSDRVAGIAAA